MSESMSVRVSAGVKIGWWKASAVFHQKKTFPRIPSTQPNNAVTAKMPGVQKIDVQATHLLCLAARDPVLTFIIESWCPTPAWTLSIPQGVQGDLQDETQPSKRDKPPEKTLHATPLGFSGCVNG
jgi:hypothetical protein